MFVMAGTGAIGLVAVFAVDLINLFYISLLGEKQIAAAKKAAAKKAAAKKAAAKKKKN